MRLVQTAAVAIIVLTIPLTRADEPQMFGAPEPIKQLHKLSGHHGKINDAMYLPTGELLTAGDDGTLRLWNVATGRAVETLVRLDQPITKLIPVYGRMQILSVSGNGDITVWQLPSPKRPWGPEQTIGEPDSELGDQMTAWASETEDDVEEWLLLEYAEAVTPRAVRVYENLNPGAVVEVLGVDENVTLWKESETPRPKSDGPLVELPVSNKRAVKRVKLILDSPKVEGWNEIDAVGLVDEAGKVHWAVRAASSSTYGQPTRRRRMVRQASGEFDLSRTLAR